jgi:hypothetical protein
MYSMTVHFLLFSSSVFPFNLVTLIPLNCICSFKVAYLTEMEGTSKICEGSLCCILDYSNPGEVIPLLYMTGMLYAENICSFFSQHNRLHIKKNYKNCQCFHIILFYKLSTRHIFRHSNIKKLPID